MPDDELDPKAVTVPRWALEFVLNNGKFWEDESWPSGEMEDALAALRKALGEEPS